MQLLGLLQQPWPELLLELLLPKHELDVLARVARLALLRHDLVVEGHLQVVGALERFAVAGEGQACGLEVQLQVRRWHVWDGDGEVDIVLLGVGGGRPLGPEDCEMLVGMERRAAR